MFGTAKLRLGLMEPRKDDPLKFLLSATLAAAMALGSAAAAQSPTDQQRIDAQRTLDQTRTTDRARHDRIDRLRIEERRAGHPSTHGDMSQTGIARAPAVRQTEVRHSEVRHSATRHTTVRHHRHRVCATRRHHRVCHWA